MKKIAIILFACTFATSLRAQKCLDINILAQMAHLEAPGTAASCFGACSTRKNEEHQTVIVDYGTQDVQLDEMVKRVGQDFTNASVAGVSVIGQMPASGQIDDARALAAKMQSMSQDERRAYAMQMAQNMQANRQVSAANSEDPQNARLVMATVDLVTRQLKLLDDEFAAKARGLREEERKERDAVKLPDYNSCPGVDKTGLPSCGCLNGVGGAYWTKIVAVEDNYNNQKTALLQSYLPRIKALVGHVEDNISKLQYGNALRTAFYKKELLSAQSSTFGFAFDISGSLIHDIRRSGADAYVNKYNADNLVLNLGCTRQK